MTLAPGWEGPLLHLSRQKEAQRCCIAILALGAKSGLSACSDQASHSSLTLLVTGLSLHLQAEYGEAAFRQQPRAPPQAPAAKIDPNAIPLGPRAEPPKAAVPPDPIPDIEWWDRPLLIKRDGEAQGQSYGEEDEETLARLNLNAITHYVQHPVPIEPPAEEAPPEAMPLMLTKKVRS